MELDGGGRAAVVLPPAAAEARRGGGAKGAGPFPPWPASYQMNLSTVLMPCNSSGLIDPETLKGWALNSFDWSTGKSAWAAARPMDCEETLLRQAEVTAAALGGGMQRNWVYRSTCGKGGGELF